MIDEYRHRLLFLLLLLPLLAGCADMQGRFGLPGPVHSEFSRTLDSEYTALATYEDAAGQDKVAQYFRGKAARARAGDMPPPDDPAKLDVPEPIREPAALAYAALTAAIGRGDWIENGALLGMAQTRYDCWVGMAATTGQADDGFGCRDKFSEAMDVLRSDAAPPAPAVYAVHFASESIGLKEDGMETVRQAARSVRNAPGWVIVLSGYTDAQEKGEISRNLAIRRAISVRNALAQQGVPLSQVRVGDLGRAPDGASADGGRRVTLEVMPESEAARRKTGRAEELLPENFGSVAPVF